MTGSNIALLTSNSTLSTPQSGSLPLMLAGLDEAGRTRFWEFFTVNIRNPNTRAAYGRAASAFFTWCEDHGLNDLRILKPVHVAAYIEELGRKRSRPTVKQHLACLRMLFDWLIVGQVILSNPATAIRGPKHSAAVGSAPVLSADEARALLDSIGDEDIVALRDRALIGLMVYTFARIEVALSMKVEDFFPERHRWWVRLHEKGGKVNKMPTHHNLQEYLHEYIDTGNLRQLPQMPLFRSAIWYSDQLTEKPLHRVNAWQMIQRRSKAAGLDTHIGNHTFRATGITVYLTNGGTIEKAQQMANHSDPRTTKLYDRRRDEVSLNEVELIRI